MHSFGIGFGIGIGFGQPSLIDSTLPGSGPQQHEIVQALYRSRSRSRM